MRVDPGALAVEAVSALALVYLAVTAGLPALQRHRERRQEHHRERQARFLALERATQTLLLTAAALRHLDNATRERARELLAEFEAEERQRRRKAP